jgi:hypothetical protein
MGESMGPAVCSGLKAKFKGEVACQGVGGAYSAGLAVCLKIASPSHISRSKDDRTMSAFREQARVPLLKRRKCLLLQIPSVQRARSSRAVIGELHRSRNVLRHS